MKSTPGRLFAVVLSVTVLFTTGVSQQGPKATHSHAEREVPDSNDKLIEERVRLDANVVNVTVSVTDADGRSVSGLAKDHFELYDNGVKQQIAHFSEDDSPLSLGIVFDVSVSMKQRIDRSANALRKFIETSHWDDDFFLIAFNDRAKLVRDFTTSGDQIVGNLMHVAPGGRTALYDAAYLAVEKAAQGRHGKKALLIVSDGQDNNSRYSYKELRDRLQEAEVAVYAIGITDPENDSLFGSGKSALQEITRLTGGRAFFPGAGNDTELAEVCARIALELRRRYSIAFYPTDRRADNTWRKVEVKLNPPKGVGRVSLAYRQSYQPFVKP